MCTIIADLITVCVLCPDSFFQKSVLINIGRGSVISEESLLKALR